MASQSDSIKDKNIVITYTLNDTSTPCRPESLDGKVFSLLHLCLIVVRDDLYGFATVYLVEVDRVATEVLDGFHCSRRVHIGRISERDPDISRERREGGRFARTRVHLPTNFNLVRLHRLLYSSPDLS